MTNAVSAATLPTKWIRKIDRSSKAITVHKAFLIASGEYGSTAYQLRMELSNRYPGFDFIQYKPNRAKTDEVYDNPTYSQMEKFIKGYEATEKGAAEAMAELNDLRMLLKGRKLYTEDQKARYQQYTFGMYGGGNPKVITLRVHRRAMNAMVDKFGKNIFPKIIDADHFEISVKVVLSPQFYAWVFGLKKYVRIMDEEAKAGMVEHLKAVMGMYE